MQYGGMVEYEDDGQFKKQKRLLFLCYALLALPWFAFIPSLAAIILLYVMAPETRPYTALEKHREWAIFTFWVSVVGGVAAALFFFIGIGFIVGGIVTIWYYYLIVKGAYALYTKKPL